MDSLETKIESKVSWAIFIPIVVLFTAVIGWMLMVANRAVDASTQARQDVSEVKGDIKAINTSIANIEKSLDKVLKYR